MAANITLPLDIRATLTNDTRRGAKQVIDETKALRIQLQKEMDFSGSAPTSGGTAADLIRKASAGIDHQEATASLRKLQAKKRYEDQKERDRDDEDFRNFLQDQKRERERIEREQRQQAVEQSRSVYEAREAIADTHAERMAQTEEQAGRESAARRIRIEREAAKQKAEIDQRLLESGDKSKEAATKARAQKDLIDLKTRRRLAEEAHAGGGAGHGTRIFSDASTTGLDPLQRFLGGALGDKLGMGVGILGGAVVTKSLADMTGKGAEFSKMIREGKLDAAGMTVEFGKSIPILGNIVEAGQNIREIITGERHELERQQEVLKSIVELQQAGVTSAIQVAEARRRDAFTLHQMRLEIEGIGKRGNPAELHGLQMQYEANTHAAKERQKKANESRMLDEQLASARQKLADFEAKHGMALDRPDAKPVRTPLGDLLGYGADKADKALNGLFKDSGLETDLFSRKGSARQRLEDDRERLVDEIKKIEMNKDRLHKGEVETAKKQQEGAEEEKEKRRKENLRLYNEQRAIEAARAASERQGVQDETSRMALERQGKLEDAQVAGAKARVSAEVRASQIAEAEQLRQTTDESMRTQIKQQESAKRIAITTRGMEEEARIRKEFSLQAVRAEFETNESLRALNVASEQERLRTTGQAGEAEIALLRSDADKKKRIIDQELAAKLAVNTSTEQEDRERAQAQKDEIDRQMQTNVRRQQEANRQRNAGIEMQLGQQGLASLQNASRLGDFGAAAKAMEEEIRLRFQGRRNELMNTIGDEHATAVQKRRAQEMLAGLDKEQRLAIATAGMSTAAGMPALVGAGRTSGAAQRFAEAHNPAVQMVRLQEKSLEVLRQQVKTQAETNRLLAESPVMKAALARRR